MMRIGHGYDVHRLVADRALILGGVEVPYELGLLGHSDADVLLHAICDAILGALGLGDIGKHFPDNDEEFKGIDSRILLRRVIAQMHQQGYVIGNLDATVICQKPKLASYIEAMKTTISSDCRCAMTRINVKATTTEKLGFCGRGEGIAAEAVVLLERKQNRQISKLATFTI